MTAEKKMTMNKAAAKGLLSMDIADEKRAQLQQLFPEAFAEGKINFDQLRRALGDWIEPGKERYGLNWPGKAECMKVIQAPSVARLKPSRDESVDFDGTENLFIEGDNLEALKLLQKSYFNKIKIIYIDPPYNTGKEFIYPDKFAENISTYLAYTGQKDSEGRKFSTNTEADGRYHSNWLNMMYPRLYLARNLLRDDGVIFISIGDDEQDNLKKVCNEIFGEENFVAQVARVAKRTSNKGTHFRPTKDYVLAYAKSFSFLPEFGVQKDVNEKDYPMVDEDGRKYKQSGASLYQPSLDSRPNQRYYIEAPDGSFIIPPGNVFPDKKEDGSKVVPKTNSDKVWRWAVDSYLKKKHLLIFTKGSSKNPLLDENGNQSKWNIYPKVYLDEDEASTLYPEDIIYDYPNSQGTKELLALDIPFSFSKPSELLKYLITITQADNDSIILDFFAGSGTTAHAVMKLNAEDGGNRKCISIQLPEPTEEDSDEFKAGFKNIADISKERIRRAAKDIEEKLAGQLALDGDRGVDTGFRVFKLSRSNFNIWDGNADTSDDLSDQLEMHIDHIDKSSSPEDILFELLLKSGFELATPVEKLSMAGKDVYSVADGAMLICFDKDITPEVIDAIAAAEPLQVICLDEGFKGNDQLKTNAVQTFKSLAKEDEEAVVFRTV